MEEKERIITEVLDNFDFERVARAMSALNIMWEVDDEMECPDASVLKWKAESLCDAVMDFYGKGNHRVCTSCGGLKAVLLEGKKLMLEYVVESSEAE